MLKKMTSRLPLLMLRFRAALAVLTILSVGSLLYNSRNTATYSKTYPTNEEKGNETNVCGECALWEADYALEITNYRATRCQTQCDSNSILVLFKNKELEYLMNDKNFTPGNYLLPPILYHISDEFCSIPEAFELYTKFDLVLRNYACTQKYRKHYLEGRHRNVMVIPLPYMAGYLNSKALTDSDKQRGSLYVAKVLEESYRNPRQFAWAFVGNMKKSNRSEMVQAFEGVDPNFISSGLKPSEIFSVYANTSFVLSGRGWRNLDCLRHYEASLVGAIPVVQGEPWEINATFGQFGQTPPWMFAKTWKEARRMVVELLSRPEELAERRLACLRWWQGQMMRTKEAFSRHIS